jgi:hypothetical protein
MSNQITRPRWITITVSLMFAVGIFNIMFAFTGATARYGMFYPAVQVLLTIGFITSLSGIWEMERWGLVLLPIILAVALAADLYLGAFRYYTLALWGPMIAFAWNRRYFK